MPEKEPTIETEEEEPKISYEIFYGAHRTATDSKKLAQVFPEADVYVPECADWTLEVLADFNALSQGKKTPQELIDKYNFPENSSWAREWKIIYQSQKPILFADLGEEHELHALDKEADSLCNQSFKEFKYGNFSEALKTMRDFIRIEAEGEKKREKVIMDNLKIQLNDLVKNTELKNKKEIKALLRLGTAHTRIFHSLKEKEPKTKRQFSNLPFVFLSQEEALRRAQFSKEIKDELLAKIFIENPLVEYSYLITDDTDKAGRMARQLSAKISFEEIKKLSKNWHRGQVHVRDEIEPLEALLERLKSDRLSPVLKEFFQDKGIKIPENEKEIDEMLGEK